MRPSYKILLTGIIVFALIFTSGLLQFWVFGAPQLDMCDCEDGKKSIRAACPKIMDRIAGRKDPLPRWAQ